MKKVEEYLHHAAECRDMARTASIAHRQQLGQMAETWEQLAEARKHQLEKLGPVEEKSKALKQSEGLTVEFVIPPARNDV